MCCVNLSYKVWIVIQTQKYLANETSSACDITICKSIIHGLCFEIISVLT